MVNVRLIAATILLLQQIRSSYGWLPPPIHKIEDRTNRSSGRQRASSKHRYLQIAHPRESNTRRYQNAGFETQEEERRQSQEALQYPLPPNPLLHLETKIEFDVLKYPLRERVLAVLGIEPSIDLSHLHEHSGRYLDKPGNSVNEVQGAWNANRNREQQYRDQGLQGLHRFIPPDAPLQYERFDEVYQAFIRDVVAPAMGGGRILFQRAPTLRVMTPLSSSDPSIPYVMSKLHNDCDYHHQPSEINFWLPLTDEVFDGNSLWVESIPGLGDFHPLELKYGQVTRFYGNQCRHYASDNRTGISRVSLDFRAVSDDSGGHNPLFRKGVRRGAKARYRDVFDVPDFYSEVMVPKYEIVAKNPK